MEVVIRGRATDILDPSADIASLSRERTAHVGHLADGRPFSRAARYLYAIEVPVKPLPAEYVLKVRTCGVRRAKPVQGYGQIMLAAT